MRVVLVDDLEALKEAVIAYRQGYENDAFLRFS
jgi:hypothetical protein